MNNWKERIVLMLMVRDEMYKTDRDGLWEYHFPEVAASGDEIKTVQEKLKVSLSEEYVNFLLHANGWKCFYQLVDLFGTEELGGDAMMYAKRLLDVETDNSEELRNLKDQLIPVAVSRADRDLFVMVLAKGSEYGKILWLAGGEIDRFDSFGDFFEAMIAYNREDLEDLKSSAP